MRWREFIIAFFVIAFAGSLPNLFVDLNAALQNKPQLALGDIIGGNLVDLTFVLAIAVFFSKKGLSAESEMVQKSALFTAIIAIVPLFLLLDGRLDRLDGLVLISGFIFYSSWLFLKKERFKKIYKSNGENPIGDFKSFLMNLAKVVILLLLLLAVSQAVIFSAQFFSQKLSISLSLVGILIIGLGNSFPEIYFSIISARKEENWMVLGNLMGSVIICSTLVLGAIALIAPFEVKDFSPFLIARIFLIVAALLSIIFIRTGRKITKKEGFIMLFVYILFLLVEIFTQQLL
ncbi:MAG: hypothetical protein A3I87_00855 [Candidatus Staskawiczbacteria bacterium RIFCSPLOWO2_02_FULL_39_8]|nr:MAG: hypothetical protein A3I87_00855 [Candidatus Staskawiczbacteria bacterium RIFCSPLOWO2_02_FULL_39_8]